MGKNYSLGNTIFDKKIILSAKLWYKTLIKMHF